MAFCLTRFALPAAAVGTGPDLGPGSVAPPGQPGLLQLSLDRPALGDLLTEMKAERAIAQLNPAQSPRHQNAPQQEPLAQAQALNARAIAEFSRGQGEAAIQTWQQAQQAYAQAGDQRGWIGSQLNQAQALQTLGLYNRARTLMADLQQALETADDPALQILGLQSLGSIFQATGYLQDSQQVLQTSLELAQRYQLDPSPSHMTLGNTLRAMHQPEAALTQYRRAAQTASDRLLRLEAQLNQLSLHLHQGQLDGVAALLSELQPQFEDLPPSRRAIYARINLSASLSQLLDLGLEASPQRGPKAQAKSDLRPSEMGSPVSIAHQLTIAVEQARQLQDMRAESYALGQLGQLYEQTQQWNDATQLTEQALQLAQTGQAADIAYRWQWQLGRIVTESAGKTLSAQQRQRAIAAYRESVQTLSSIRGDLVATNPEIQFSFRESIEPVYRELMALLIQPDANEAELAEARDAIEALQLAELENFFRSACLEVTRQQIDSIDKQAAVFYPIILPDRLEVLLSLPGQPLTHHTAAVGQPQMEQTLQAWLESLNPAASLRRQTQLAQQLYGWLVAPVRTQLEQQGIKTLVFVPDGPLRNLPMSALHDGQQYLIENYQVALTPGLQLLEPRAITPNQLQALSVGLTEARQGFSALPGVRQEIEQIQANLPAKVILDEAFTKANLKQQLADSSYPIVHLATHGQFSSDPEQTFLLTWDDTIKVRDIRSLLKARGERRSQPIELLVLSACQTATGDSQAALGLAGLAVQSGARSTLATLWAANDRSTAQLMTRLYEDLASSQYISRGESLRQAQLALMEDKKYSHPFYWSTFVLVGNWL